MGFFSWKTADTNESISNKYSDRGALPVKMIDDKNNVYIEMDYEGYGVFGGVDFYSLLDKMNGGNGDREMAIGMEFCYGIKSPKIVSLSCEKTWDELENNENCDYQGFFYPDRFDELLNIKKGNQNETK